MNEKFAIKVDPNNENNFGVVWEYSGTQGGFTSERAARKSALQQSGVEASADEAQAWEW